MTTSRHPDIQARLSRAERIVGHTFADKDLLLAAITHPSAVEHPDPNASYERLEFLGDAVVGLIIADEVYRRFESMHEGGMTLIKIAAVSGATLARIAQELGLDEVVIFGSSERGTGGRGLTSALENVFEAITGALYLDAGIDAATSWVIRTLGPHLDEGAALAPDNPKSRLQELAQAKGLSPTYTITSESGPPHERTFQAEVSIGSRRLGAGTGRTKKEAEAAAAAEALAAIEDEPL